MVGVEKKDTLEFGAPLDLSAFPFSDSRLRDLRRVATSLRIARTALTEFRKAQEDVWCTQGICGSQNLQVATRR